MALIKLEMKLNQVFYAVGLANPILTWETMKIYNGGIDLSFSIGNCMEL